MAAGATLGSPATILITGATSGIGAALARCYAAPGRTLILHGRNEARLGVVAKDCEAKGAKAIAFLHDLSDQRGFRAQVDALTARTPIDLAIVNAGVTHGQAGEGEPLEVALHIIEVNLVGALATVDALLPHMRARRSGQIALVSSLAAYHGLASTPAYCASKSGLMAYGEAIRSWLAPQGVRVSVVLPGFVRTPMNEGLGKTPFMIEAEDAALRIQRGLARGKARIAFPQPLAFGAWLLTALPAAWSQWIVEKSRL